MEGPMKDLQDREYAKLNDLKAGEIVEIDGGFECRREGKVVLMEDEGRLFFLCDEGKHFLDGQLVDEETDDSLIGIYKLEV
jgi:hypothetical protein